MNTWTGRLSAAALAVWCGISIASNADPGLAFTPITPALSDSEKRQVRASTAAIIDDRASSIAYHTLLRTGQSVGDHVYGQLLDDRGEPIVRYGQPAVSHSNDFTSLIQAGDQLLMLSQFEDRPGAAYLSQLSQDANTGLLDVKRMRPLDFSPLQGGWLHCAGTVTPWNSHLASEEYPPDGRYAADPEHPVGAYFAPMADYFADQKTTPVIYRYGFPIEIAVSGFDKTAISRHYSMGRISHEKAIIMPDQRTAYLSDDESNAVFLRYVATKAGDLSAGQLFAARWVQTSDQNGGQARLEWIDLGNANDDEIQLAIDGGIRFDDIFSTAEPSTRLECPDAYTRINITGEAECLRLKPGMETLASRLETRRYAALKGATTEFRKLEGSAFDPNTRSLYLSVSSIHRGMLDGHRHYDAGGPNHIRLSKNRCGGVYRVSMDENFVATFMQAELLGLPLTKKYGAREQSKPYDKQGPLAANTCDIDQIANPDNLALDSERGVLFIGEDSGSGHQNDAIWAYDLQKMSLSRLLTSPYGSETTSIAWFPDINGWSYLMANIQHPYGESDQDKRKTTQDISAYTGYLGPFPTTAFGTNRKP